MKGVVNLSEKEVAKLAKAYARASEHLSKFGAMLDAVSGGVEAPKPKRRAKRKEKATKVTVKNVDMTKPEAGILIGDQAHKQAAAPKKEKAAPARRGKKEARPAALQNSLEGQEEDLEGYDNGEEEDLL